MSFTATPAPWLLAEQSTPGSTALPASGGQANRDRDHKIVTLLVEDNRADVLIVQEAISCHNLPLELYVVEDGEKAFAFIEDADRDPKTPCPELLLLDLNLPKRSGKEILQRVRESEKCRHIPVLIVTSSNSPNDRRDVAKLGANGYFVKPSNYDDFLKIGEAIRALIDEDKQ